MVLTLTGIKDVGMPDNEGQSGSFTPQRSTDTYRDGEIGGRSLNELKAYFEDYRNLTQEGRQESLIHIDFYDGYQWAPEEIAQLKLRKQPETTTNRIRPAINGILGVIEKSRADPKCWPRSPQDEDAADVGTDTLTYIYKSTRFVRKKVDVFWDVLVPGIGALIVEVDDKKNVLFNQIRWEEYFCDPRSRYYDARDARYEGIAKWMYVDDVIDIFPEKEEELRATLTSGSPGVVDQSFQDRPLHNMWIDGQNKRLLIIEVYYKNRGKWWRCMYHSNGVLEHSVSPYNDEEGSPTNPIVSLAAYVDRENKRYGVVKDMVSIQREINKRRSKLLHAVSSSRIQARDPSAIEVDADTARLEAARPDGVIPYGWEAISNTDMSAGQMQLLAESKGEMERLGPNPAMAGRGSADASGKALLARQQAGIAELAIIFGRLDDWELRVYRQAWARVKQFWTAEKWIRVNKDPDTPTFIGLNMPKGPQIPQVDPATGQMMQHPQVDEAGQPHPQAGQPMTVEGPPEMDDQGEPVHGRKNQVAMMDLDIEIDTSPETANIMAEMFHDIIALLQASPVYAEQIPFDLVLELSPMPHKRQVMERIKAHLAEQQQGAAQQQQQDAMIKKMQSDAEIGNIESRTLKNEAQAHQIAINAHGDAKDILSPPLVAGPPPDAGGA